MPVKLWTGLPGAGKTASMVSSILAFKVKNPDRPVYAININGLHESVATKLTLDQLHKWWELPPGAVICIDECQEDDYFPTDRGQPPEWVKRVSKVRHEGMDFWLCTQHPNLMSSYIRRLVDEHVHFVRKFKSSVVQSHAWGRCMESCEKGAAQKVAVTGVSTLPSEVFELYKSSNAHTMKRKIPARVYMFVALVLVAIVAVVAVPVMIKRAQDRNIASIQGKAGNAPGDASGKGVAVDQQLRVTDYAKWMTPRIPGAPWTAPAFDGAAVKAEPKLFCIADDTGKCICNTEQGTRYKIDLNQCRAIVSDGGLYNPFEQPKSEQVSPGSQERAPPVKPQAPPVRALADVDTGGTGAYSRGVGVPAYTPPELTKVSALTAHMKQ